MNERGNEIKKLMEGYVPAEGAMGGLMDAAEGEPMDELEQRRILARAMEQIRAEDGIAEHMTEKQTWTEYKSVEDSSVKRGAERDIVHNTEFDQAHRPHWRRRLAIACAAVMMLSAGTFAADVMSGGLAELLGGSQRQNEIISDMGTVLELSESLGGYTVAPKQMIHDRSGCYILIDVSRDDGQLLEEGYYGFASSTVGLPEITSSGWYVTQPLLHDGTADTVTLLLHYASREKVAGKTMRVTLNDFGKDAEGEFEVLAGGQWVFEIEVGSEDNTQTFHLDQPVTIAAGQGEKTVTVKTMYLSPLSVTMDVSNNLESFDPREFRILLKDGTEVGYQGGGYGSGHGIPGFMKTQIDLQFDQVIDPAEIAEIWFNGTELKL